MAEYDYMQKIKESRGNKSVAEMIHAVLWQAARDEIILTRARDMVWNQPWEGYDNLSYE